MSNESAHSLKVSVSRSRYLAIFVTVIHILAMVAGIVNGLPWSLRITISLLVVFSFIYSLKHYRLVGAIDTVTISFSESGGWILQVNDQEPAHVKLLGSSVVTLWMAILCFKKETRIVPVLLLPDNIDEEEFRKLRVLVRTLYTS